MQHLACFAGGMFAYGAKFAEDENEELQVRTPFYEVPYKKLLYG